MFKEIRIMFVDDSRTNIKVLRKKPKTKKRRIMKKWFKRHSILIPDTVGCAVVGQGLLDTGEMIVYAVAHPLSKENMEKMNSANDGNQPLFVWDFS